MRVSVIVTVVATILVSVAGGIALVGLLGVTVQAEPVATAGELGQSSMTDRDKLVGTYRLITTEQRATPDDEWTPTPGYHSIGYITYGETGHMGVHVMPRNRPLFTSDQPTPEEAQAALRGYTAYFGTFSVDEANAFVVHHRVGQINPGGAVDAKRYYEFDGDRLILIPAPADGGGKDSATRRVVWERLPEAPLSAEAKKFVGFYKLLYTDRYRERNGELVFHGEENRSRADTSYIIYTPSGHMMAHLLPNDGRTPYASAQPTPDEALATYRSYFGYFGRFTTYENYDPPFVMHNQQGSLRPGGNVDATKRFYQFTGNILRLGGPPRLNEDGEWVGGHLYWERLTSPE